ncbi:hypothetical protein EV363DRAFT_1178894 [Boletus edulis]|nr:hypothetical protein EV363DRAFT_1178894 [Boletus edulis]
MKHGQALSGALLLPAVAPDKTLLHSRKMRLVRPFALPLSRSAISDSRIEENMSSGPLTYPECSSLTDG